MNIQKLLMLSCATGALVGVGGAAIAQESTGIGEVVVTAEKRAQSIQEVPVAVTAITGEQRDILGITTAQDVANFTPGMNRTNGDRVSLRGAGKFNFFLGSDPGVANYTDGFYQYGFSESFKPPIFVNRLEILRGPQGTLYGRNSMGGALNTISNRPTDEWEAEIRGAVGNYATRNLAGYVSGPIFDNFRIRATASTNIREEGFIENIGLGPDNGDWDKTYLELQLDWDVTSSVHAWVRYSRAIWDDNTGVGNPAVTLDQPYNVLSFGGGVEQYNYCAGPGGVLGSGIAAPNPALGQQPGQDECFGAGFIQNPAVNELHTINIDRPQNASFHNTELIIGQFDFDLGDDISLKYTTGYQTYFYDSNGDTQYTSRTDRYDVFNYNAGDLACATPQPIDPLTGAPTVPNTSLGILAAAPPIACGMASNMSTDTWTDGAQAGFFYSNEINIQNSAEAEFHWILGVFQYHENTIQRITSYAFGQEEIADANAFFNDPANLYLPAPALGSLRGLIYGSRSPLTGYQNGRADGNNTGNTYAVYGQTDWNFTEDWTLTFGLRYSHDNKTNHTDSAALIFNPITLVPGYDPAGVRPDYDGYYVIPLPAAPFAFPLPMQNGVIALPLGGAAGGDRRMSDSSNAMTGVLGLQWEPDSETNVYARYSRGYKALGFTAATATPDPFFDPEFVDAFEVGFKRDFGPTFRTNVSLFLNEYEDLQVYLTTINPANQTVTSLSHNIDAETYGAEIEAIWAPTENWQFLFGYGYLHSEVTDMKSTTGFFDGADLRGLSPNAKPLGAPFINTSPFGPPTQYQNQNLNGNQLPMAPEHKFSVIGSYNWSNDWGNFIFTTAVSYTGDLTQSLFPSDVYRTDEVTVGDFRLVYTEPEGRFTAIAFVKNVTDEDGTNSNGLLNPTARTVPGTGTQTDWRSVTREVTPLDPRTFGLELQYRF